MWVESDKRCKTCHAGRRGRVLQAVSVGAGIKARLRHARRDPLAGGFQGPTEGVSVPLNHVRDTIDHGGTDCGVPTGFLCEYGCQRFSCEVKRPLVVHRMS